MSTNGHHVDRVTQAGVDRAAIADTTVLIQVGEVSPDSVPRHPVAPLCQGLAALGFKEIHLRGAIEYLEDLDARMQGARFFQEPAAWLDEGLFERASAADIIIDLTNDPELTSLCAHLGAARGANLISLAWGRTWVRLRGPLQPEATSPGPDAARAATVEPCLPLSRIVAGLALQEALMHAGQLDQATPAGSDVTYNVASDSRTGTTDSVAWSDARVENASIELIGIGAIGTCFVDAFVPLLGPDSELRIFDRDVVAPENLGLQLLYTPDDVGRPKAVVAAERLPGVCHASVRIRPFVMDYQERPRGLSAPTLRVSAVDNFAARQFANQLCVTEGVALADAGSSPLAARQATYYPGHTACLEHRIPNLGWLAAAETDSASCSDLRALTLPPVNVVIGGILAAEALRALNPPRYGWPSRGTIVVDLRFPERFAVIDDRPPCTHSRVHALQQGQSERTASCGT